MAGRLKKKVYVIEGDIAGELDAKRLERAGLNVRQIETQGSCHLPPASVLKVLEELKLEPLDLVIIENVGNLVCPSSFDLGENMKIVVSSVTEGDDKPRKYPHIFTIAGGVILTKCDLLPHTNFQISSFENRLRKLNPHAPLIKTSISTSEGMDNVASWLQNAP